MIETIGWVADANKINRVTLNQNRLNLLGLVILGTVGSTQSAATVAAATEKKPESLSVVIISRWVVTSLETLLFSAIELCLSDAIIDTRIEFSLIHPPCSYSVIEWQDVTIETRSLHLMEISHWVAAVAYTSSRFFAIQLSHSVRAVKTLKLAISYFEIALSLIKAIEQTGSFSVIYLYRWTVELTDQGTVDQMEWIGVTC